MFLPVTLAAVAAVTWLFPLSGVQTSSALAAAHLYPVAILLPLGALTAVVGEHREFRYRAGGTAWRATSAVAIQLARLTVVAGYATVGHSVMALILADGFPQAAAFVVIETAAFLGAYGLGLLSWRVLGRAALIVTPLLALATSGLGAVQAESPTWWARPWTWSVRPTLPLYGVHGNSVPAHPSSGVFDIAVAPALLLHIALGAVAFALALALPRRRGKVAVPAAVDRLPGSTRTSVLRALALALPWRLWLGLAVTLWGALAVIRVVWSAEVAAAVLAFFAVPAAASIAGVMSWTSHSAAWRGLLTRSRRKAVPPAVCLILFAFLAPVLLIAGALAGATPYQLVVLPTVAAMISAVCLLAATRSVAVAIIVSVGMTAWSLMVTGDVLAATGLWWTAGWAWTWTVVGHPGRWVIIVAVAALVALVSGGAFAQVTRRG